VTVATSTGFTTKLVALVVEVLLATLLGVLAFPVSISCKVNG
jgi:hypothetical protein